MLQVDDHNDFQKQGREIMSANRHGSTSDRNIPVRVAEKLPEYKDLEIEIARMWGMKVKFVPVVIGALRVIKKGNRQANQ